MRYFLKSALNPQGLEAIAVMSRRLPNEVATIIGDVVHNLRTGLDLLASDAVRANGNEPTRNTGFPIYQAELDFNGGVIGKLDGAPVTFVDFVKGLKPYRIMADGNDGNVEIWTLGQLDNDDKHITLLPTAALATLSNVVAVHEKGPEFGLISMGQVVLSGHNAAIFYRLGRR